MDKRILIIGHAPIDNVALARILAEKKLDESDVLIISPEEAEKQGLKFPEPTTVKGSVEELILKFSEVKHEEIFIPKKVHPKHQQQNKYRFKK